LLFRRNSGIIGLSAREVPSAGLALKGCIRNAGVRDFSSGVPHFRDDTEQHLPILCPINHVIKVIKIITTFLGMVKYNRDKWWWLSQILAPLSNVVSPGTLPIGRRPIKAFGEISQLIGRETIQKHSRTIESSTSLPTIMTISQVR